VQRTGALRPSPAWGLARLAVAYGATSPDHIEEKIRTGALPGHPACEDTIRWEGLEAHRLKLLAALAGGKQVPYNG